MTAFQIGWSRALRRERLRALAWRVGVYTALGLWGCFSWYPLHRALFGLEGWGAVAFWAALGVWDAVVITNRAFALVLVDDEGMDLRSFFTRRRILWTQVSDIAIELRPSTKQRVLRVYRKDGHPITVPGAVTPGTTADPGPFLPNALAQGTAPPRYAGIVEADLDSKATALREQWQRALGQAGSPTPLP
ncbi:hypothetical protein ABH931_002747 [Streptacidiphilus sp. MAP12-33]|uniref:hypothetical protein n=1 Tax=Streptacidiphilus sp. MAP12-33 TaxID=3156266 RepID=UPI0035149848